MESQNLSQHNNQTIKNSIDNWYIRMGKALSNEKRFDVKSAYKVKKAILISAMERITNSCDIEESFLEKVNKYTNELY